MLNYEDRPFRPCVGIIVKNKAGLVFMGERQDNPGAWQFPQGGIDDGENITQAAMRELAEETNISSVKILAQTTEWLYYDIPLHLTNKLWNGQFRGQKQIWFLMEFLGNESEIQLDKHHEIEFTQYQFVAPHLAVDLTVEFKRDIYTQIIQYFGPWL